MILDEATAGLDPASRDSVLRRPRGTLTEGRTSITITHDVLAALACDRVIWLEDGQILEDGPPLELLRDPASHFSNWLGDAQSPQLEPDGAGRPDVQEASGKETDVHDGRTSDIGVPT